MKTVQLAELKVGDIVYDNTTTDRRTGFRVAGIQVGTILFELIEGNKDLYWVNPDGLYEFSVTSLGKWYKN